MIERLAEQISARDGNPMYISRFYARVAIEGMPEPTEAMIKAAMPWSDAAGAIDTWRAMIDEALR